MERTPYLRYVKDFLQYAEDSQVFGAEALAQRAKAESVCELSQVDQTMIKTMQSV